MMKKIIAAVTGIFLGMAASFLLFSHPQLSRPVFALDCTNYPDPWQECQDSALAQCPGGTMSSCSYTDAYNSCIASKPQSEFDQYTACTGCTGDPHTSNYVCTSANGGPILPPAPSPSPAPSPAPLPEPTTVYVEAGMDITTGANERKALIMCPNYASSCPVYDQSVVILGPNSTYHADSPVIDQIANKEEDAVLAIGKLYYYIKHFINKTVIVHATNAVLAVRGTQFLTVDGQNSTTVKMIDGTADVTAGGKTVSLSTGFQVTVPANGQPGNIVPIAISADDKSWVSTPFPDVALDNHFFAAINYLKINGIVGGYPDGTYKPLNQINRAEFTKIVVGAVTQNATGSNCFPDVKSEWFASFVCYAKANGIIGGYPDGTFKSDRNVNLAEALKIVELALNVQLSANKGSNWYDVYINTAQEKGILTAVGTTEPSHLVNRGEMAEIIFKLKQ